MWTKCFYSFAWYKWSLVHVIKDFVKGKIECPNFKVDSRSSLASSKKLLDQSQSNLFAYLVELPVKSTQR